jgi:hypothetical protein
LCHTRSDIAYGVCTVVSTLADGATSLQLFVGFYQSGLFDFLTVECACGFVTVVETVAFGVTDVLMKHLRQIPTFSDSELSG